VDGRNGGPVGGGSVTAGWLRTEEDRDSNCFKLGENVFLIEP
jgi:hypothetical protein